MTVSMQRCLLVSLAFVAALHLPEISSGPMSHLHGALAPHFRTLVEPVDTLRVAIVAGRVAYVLLTHVGIIKGNILDTLYSPLKSIAGMQEMANLKTKRE
jgi:hypothetical protein